METPVKAEEAARIGDCNQEIHSTCSPPDAPQHPDFPLLSNILVGKHGLENNAGQPYASKRVANSLKPQWS